MNRKTNSLTALFFLLMILLLGSFLRIYKISEVPAGFSQDEAATGYDAYSLIRTGRDHHGALWPITFQTFNEWDIHSFVYQLIPLVYLSGLNKYSLRITVAIISIFTSVLIYLFSKEFTGSVKVSLLSSLIFSVSVFSIFSSRWATPPNTAAFFMTLNLFLFYSGINRPGRRRLIWIFAGFAIGFSLYSYASLEGFLPIWLTALVILIFKKRTVSKIKITDLLILCTISLVIYFPLLKEHLQNPATLTRINMTTITGQDQNPFAKIAANYLSILLPFHLFIQGDGNPSHAIPGFGFELLFPGIFYCLGMYLLFFNKKMLLRRFPGLDDIKIESIKLFVLLSPLFPSLFLPIANLQRITFYIPVMILITCLGIDHSILILHNLFHQKPRKSIFFGVLFFIIIYMVQFGYWIKCYFGPEYQAVAELYFQGGMEDLISYTKSLESDYKAIVIDDFLNQPYIYILFFTKVNPSTLNYSDFKEYDPVSKWLRVKKFKNYYFLKISENDIKDARYIRSIYSSPYSSFDIYDKKDIMIVRYVGRGQTTKQ